MLDGNKVIESLGIGELQTLLLNKNLTELQKEYVQQVLTHKEGQKVGVDKKNKEIEILRNKKNALGKEKNIIEDEIESVQIEIWEDYVHTLSQEELERELAFVNSVYGVGSYRCCYIERLQNGEVMTRRTLKGDYSNYESHVDMYQDEITPNKNDKKVELEKLMDEYFS